MTPYFPTRRASCLSGFEWISRRNSNGLSGKGRAPRQCAGVGSETPAPDADTLGAGCTFSPISRTVSDGASPTTVMWTEPTTRPYALSAPICEKPWKACALGFRCAVNTEIGALNAYEIGRAHV